MCECKNGDCYNKADLSKVVHPSADSEENVKVLVDEISVKVSEHYKELRMCVSTVNGLVQSVESRVERVEDPCGQQRRALEACYCCHHGKILLCEQFVNEFADCVKNYALRHL